MRAVSLYGPVQNDLPLVDADASRTVQVIDAVTYDAVVSGTFIHMLVTSDRLRERIASQLEGM